MTTRAINWLIPQRVLDRSLEELAADGALGREGIALWGGIVEPGGSGDTVLVTQVILLRGSGVVRGAGYIGISPELLNDVTDLLAVLDGDVYLAGQIHGHPPLSSTDLSEVDIAHGIRTPNYLSVVAPHYGMLDEARLDVCGIHVYEQLAGWRRLEQAEIAARIAVLSPEEIEISCLVIGGEHHARRKC